MTMIDHYIERQEVVNVVMSTTFAKCFDLGLNATNATYLAQALSHAIHALALTSTAISPMHSRSFGAPSKQALAMAEKKLGANYTGLGVAADAVAKKMPVGSRTRNQLTRMMRHLNIADQLDRHFTEAGSQAWLDKFAALLKVAFPNATDDQRADSTAPKQAHVTSPSQLVYEERHADTCDPCGDDSEQTYDVRAPSCPRPGVDSVIDKHSFGHSDIMDANLSQNRHLLQTTTLTASSQAICTYFMQGKCKYGGNCWFRHSVDDSVLNDSVPADTVTDRCDADSRYWLNLLQEVRKDGVQQEFLHTLLKEFDGDVPCLPETVAAALPEGSGCNDITTKLSNLEMQLSVQAQELSGLKKELYDEPIRDHRSGVEFDLDALHKRIDVIEAQLEASSRDVVPPGCTSIDSLMSEYNNSSLDDRFHRLRVDTLSSLHGFIESHLTEKTNDLFDTLSGVIKSVDAAIRKDFNTLLRKLKTDDAF